MDCSRWKMGFHLMPPTGWLNDPNGLCQLRGTYHVFHQYSPAWPAPNAPRGWGHFTSRDLVTWEHHGMVVQPDTADEASGSYSGCAVVMPGAAADGGDALRLYYTGNVKEPGDFDYIRTGRRAAQILIESDDGMALGPKRVILRNADYPADCTCHVRDPKVWRDGDGWWMILGARDVEDRGLILLMRSEDGVLWTSAGEVRSPEPFGYMWECPDRIVLDGRVHLSFCPQGMEGLPWSNGMRDQSGYVPMPDGTDLSAPGASVDVRAFRRWDAGFDFYAPQSFTDETGRTLLIGWMGMPEPPFDSAPGGLTWCHCLTVPRVLTRLADGTIAQLPAPELERLREAEEPLAVPGTMVLPGRRADIELAGIEGPLRLTLDGGLQIAFDGRELSCTFIGDACRPDGIGAGRTRRSAPLESLSSLRVLVDGSAVEVFAEGGRTVMSTRWFPVADALSVSLDGCCASARAWSMGDGMPDPAGA